MTDKHNGLYDLKKIKEYFISKFRRKRMTIEDWSLMPGEREELPIRIPVLKDFESPTIEAMSEAGQIYSVVVKDLAECYAISKRADRFIKIATRVVKSEHSLDERSKLYNACGLLPKCLLVLANCLPSEIPAEKYKRVERKIFAPSEKTLLQLGNLNFERDKILGGVSYETIASRVLAIKDFVKQMRERALTLEEITRQDFYDYGLGSFLRKFYGDSPEVAFKSVGYKLKKNLSDFDSKNCG